MDTNVICLHIPTLNEIFLLFFLLLLFYLLTSSWCGHVCIDTTCQQQRQQERLKRRNTLGCLDQYAAQKSKYARPPIPSQPPTRKVFFPWHTRYDPTMKHSHCETVYANQLFQWLFFELVHFLRILSILPTFKLAGITKNANDVHKKLTLVWVWN